MPNPLFPGPRAIHTGCLSLGSELDGGGSRSRRSARVGGGAGVEGAELDDPIENGNGVLEDEAGAEDIAFWMNQVFLSVVVRDLGRSWFVGAVGAADVEGPGEGPALTLAVKFLYHPATLSFSFVPFSVLARVGADAE